MTATQIGKILVDRDTAVSVNGKPVWLTNSEFCILELLISSQGSVVTRRMLYDRLYSGTREIYRPKPEIINVFVCKLRKKLSGAASEDYIEAVYGEGYRLKGGVDQ